MKKCTWCGKEYPEDAVVCAIDQQPLESDAPAPAAPSPESESDVLSVDSADTQVQTGEEDTGAPDGFRCLGRFEPFDAARLLKRFEADGIRFQIDKFEKSIVTSRGTRKMGLIEIYVHLDDDDRANKILTEGWVV